MEQFVAVALAHFLALLIPGVDFFLVTRTALTAGWRVATGACLGIALANGVFIAAAFSSVSLISHPGLLAAIQIAGGAFLIVIGVAFLRSAPSLVAVSAGSAASAASAAEVASADLGGPGAGSALVPSPKGTRWAGALGLGFTSGILNPKNALFYVSLAAAIPSGEPAVLLGYGAWMFSVVLAWDIGVALLLGSRAARARLERAVPWVSRTAGAVLVLLGAGMAVSAVSGLLG